MKTISPDQIKVGIDDGSPEMRVHLWTGYCMYFPDDEATRLASALKNYVEVVDVDNSLQDVLHAIETITGCEFASDDGNKDEDE